MKGICRVFANEEDFLQWKETVPKELEKAIDDPDIGGQIQMRVKILDTYYGADRNLEKDLGGYVLLLAGSRQETEEGLKALLTRFKLQEDDYEYLDTVDRKIWGQKVQFRLYLCSSDYGVEVVTITEEGGSNNEDN